MMTLKTIALYISQNNLRQSVILTRFYWRFAWQSASKIDSSEIKNLRSCCCPMNERSVENITCTQQKLYISCPKLILIIERIKLFSFDAGDVSVALSDSTDVNEAT